jgi:hypothetical protein
MTNAHCYNIEGITVCPPKDIERFQTYGLIGLATLAALLLLGAITIYNGSLIGTELLNGPIDFIGI